MATTATNAKRDYYEVQQVQRTATDQEIKSSYRRLAMQYHPDRNPDNKDAEEKFKECSEAFEVLSHPEKRETYDRFGHAGANGHGFDFSGTNFTDIFEEFFGDVFGGGRRGGRRH